MEIKLYNIGEMSRLFNLSVQTLRYYDKIGLFIPAYRETNGYRKYKFEQIYKLAAICHLRELGYPLKLIAEIMNTRNVDTSLNEMENRLHYVRREIRYLQNTENILDRKIHFIKREVPPFDSILEDSIQNFETRYYILIGNEETLYQDKSFYLNPTIVFYDDRGDRKFGAYLGTSKELRSEDKCMKSIQAGKYLILWHKGGYDTIWQHVLEIREKYRNLNLESWSVHFNIVDQFIEKNPEHYLTKIQILIKI